MAAGPDDQTEASAADHDFSASASASASASVDEATLRETILRLAAARGSDKTICPSEVARELRGSDEKAWRLLMKPIRREAVALADEGRVTIRRKGRAVDPHDFRGIYRIAVAEDRVADAEDRIAEG